MGNRIYLDYCATTPIHPDVRQAMLAALEADFGNPSSMHWAGIQAAGVVSAARLETAAAIGCHPGEIIFTSGATEADNLALLGVMRQVRGGHLITTSVEHHAILHSAAQLESEGSAVTYLPVDGYGRVDAARVQAALRPETALISVMLVNNETGAIQPVAEIGALARRHGILMHSDAVQAVGLLDVDVQALNVDLLSLSAHKIYGPKGIGALYVRQGVLLQPLAYGGSQEKALRPGTENVPGIAGLGAAMRLTHQHKASALAHVQRLRTRLLAGLHERIPGLLLNGPPEGAVHILSVFFPQAVSEMMLLRLSAAGVAVSLGSACNAHSIEASHVLLAMGLPRPQIDATLRISLGSPTTSEEIDQFLDLIPEVYARSRAG